MLLRWTVWLCAATVLLALAYHSHTLRSHQPTWRRHAVRHRLSTNVGAEITTDANRHSSRATSDASPPSSDHISGMLALWLGGRGARSPVGCHTDCHPQPHCDMWGEAVGPSGAKNLQPDAGSCCESCRAHGASARKKPCNVWVHCGDEKSCGPNFRHCWLKHQDDPWRAPAVSGLGWSWNKLVPWTSGVVGGPPAGWARARIDATASPSLVAFDTPLGSIRVRLARHASPNATRWLLERARATPNPANKTTSTAATKAMPATTPGVPAAGHEPCSGCRFYRAEPVPARWGVEWFFGPPYALLQVRSLPLTRALAGLNRDCLIRRATLPLPALLLCNVLP